VWSRAAQSLVGSIRAPNGRASVNAISAAEFAADCSYRAALDDL
jgi:hypothetical protein